MFISYSLYRAQQKKNEELNHHTVCEFPDVTDTASVITETKPPASPRSPVFQRSRSSYGFRRNSQPPVPSQNGSLHGVVNAGANLSSISENFRNDAMNANNDLNSNNDRLDYL